MKKELFEEFLELKEKSFNFFYKLKSSKMSVLNELKNLLKFFKLIN